MTDPKKEDREQALVERLQREIDTCSCCDATGHLIINGLYEDCGECSILKEALAALRQSSVDKMDAERYRLLRDETYVEAYYIDGAGGIDVNIRLQGSGKFLDEAIDADLAKKE